MFGLELGELAGELAGELSDSEVDTGDLLDLATPGDICLIERHLHHTVRLLPSLSLHQLMTTSTVLAGHTAALFARVKQEYGAVFPELGRFVTGAAAYARVVQAGGPTLLDLTANSERLAAHFAPDTVLVIQMAAAEQTRRGVGAAVDWLLVESACRWIVAMDDAQQQVNSAVAVQLRAAAPTLCALVGEVVAGRLLELCGGVRGVATTPSCNLPTLGRAVTGGAWGVLDWSRLVEEAVAEAGEGYHKQVLRMVSGKCVLAARMDCAQPLAAGETGAGAAATAAAWRAEVVERARKVLAPPDQAPVKALPLPPEQRGKQRGGRRVRRWKEKHGPLEMQRMANRMEFGTAERTVMGADGREVGLGMARVKRGPAGETWASGKRRRA